MRHEFFNIIISEVRVTLDKMVIVANALPSVDQVADFIYDMRLRYNSVINKNSSGVEDKEEFERLWLGAMKRLTVKPELKNLTVLSPGSPAVSRSLILDIHKDVRIRYETGTYVIGGGKLRRQPGADEL